MNSFIMSDSIKPLETINLQLLDQEDIGAENYSDFNNDLENDDLQEFAAFTD